MAEYLHVQILKSACIVVNHIKYLTIIRDNYKFEYNLTLH